MIARVRENIPFSKNDASLVVLGVIKHGFAGRAHKERVIPSVYRL